MKTTGDGGGSARVPLGEGWLEAGRERRGLYKISLLDGSGNCLWKDTYRIPPWKSGKKADEVWGAVSRRAKITREEFDQALKELEEEVEKIPEIEELEEEEKEEDPSEVAQQLLATYRFLTPMDSQIIYVYEGGRYWELGEAWIEKRVQELYPRAKASWVHEIVEEIRHSTFCDPSKFNSPPPNLVCVENGILDILTGELRPHTPDLVFLAKLPVRYDPQADCPKIRKFLEEVCPDESDRRVLLEFFGYCLYRRYDFQQALMLIGEGETGKSTCLGILRALLGRESVAARSLQELVSDKFAVADLFGKLANIFPDLPSAGLADTGMFKALTGRDLIKAERKWGQPFTFENYAKLVFSCNQLPSARDQSDAFFRRWVIITFNQRIPPEKRDPKLLEKLTTPEELSGLLNLVVRALREALERGRLSYSRSTEEVRQEYLRRSDPEAFFVQTCLAADAGWGVAKKVLYRMFQEFCRMWKLVPVSDNTFHRRLPGLMGGLAEFRSSFPPKELGEKARRVLIWAGIRPREEVVEGMEVDTTYDGLKVVLGYNRLALSPEATVEDSSSGGQGCQGSSDSCEKTSLQKESCPPSSTLSSAHNSCQGCQGCQGSPIIWDGGKVQSNIELNFLEKENRSRSLTSLTTLTKETPRPSPENIQSSEQVGKLWVEEEPGPSENLVPVSALKEFPGGERAVVDLQGGKIVEVPWVPGQAVWVSPRTARILVEGGYAEYVRTPDGGREADAGA
jgi:putative DNA primase/helicase